MAQDAFVLSHLGLGDNILLIGAVRYLATLYKKVYVVCKEHNKENMEIFYRDNTNIIIYPVKHDKDISPKLGCPIKQFEKVVANKIVYLSGAHLLNKRPISYDLFPLNFYMDMNISPSYLWDYFSIYTSPKSQELFSLIGTENKYIFIHNSCSTGLVFNIEDMEQKLNFNKNEILVINPSKNMYPKDHKFYNLADKFLNHKLPYYVTLIINASKIVITDSSFFCLCINLPIKTYDCYVVSRDNRNFEHLWNGPHKSTSKNKRKFLSIKL
jgi:hypothetical protein